jgi:sigma-B regulation protein RsbU (phosphoserine phosphatase)
VTDADAPCAEATSAEQRIDDLEDLFENAPCGYLSTDKDGRIGRANRTLATWLGVEAAGLAGRRFSDLLTVGGKLFYETHLAPLLRMQGSFSEVAVDLARADGQKLPVLVNGVERRDDEGHPLFIRITVFRAVERRRYEQNLLGAKRSAEEAVRSERETAELREQFIAVLGHDLRNPFAAIASGARLLEREQLSERGRSILKLLEQSVGRAGGLIDNVLDFARARLGGGIQLSTDPEARVADVIGQVVAELRASMPQRKIEAEIDVTRPVPVDPARFGQLLSNLLGNALTHGAESLPVQVIASTDHHEFRLSVVNGGAPISASAMEHLFRPFFRGKVRRSQQGLGLGLYIAAEIAKAHNGTLTAESNREETRFTFAMPL